MVGYEEKALCRKVANVFERAANEYYEIIDFTTKWLSSDTAEKIYNRDFNEIAQSYAYILNSLKNEYKTINIDISANYNELAYWLGYMVCYIGFMIDASPKEVWNKYDIIRYAQSFDTLHTLSSKRAAEECIEEFKR